MGTFVLVHGSWHGGWCWSRLVPVLQAAGHTVFAPTLAGLGDRVAEAGPTVGLSEHVADVVGLVRRRELRDVVLVGASYGGPVISGVAADLPDRVRHLFFLDGLVPDAGQSCFDLMPGTRDGFLDAARSAGSSWAVPSPPPQFFGIVEPEDVAWAGPLLTPMPIKTHDERLAVTPPASIPGTYLRCDGFEGFDAQMTPAIRRGYDILHVGAGHDLQVTDAPALAEILLPLACRPREGSRHRAGRSRSCPSAASRRSRSIRPAEIRTQAHQLGVGAGGGYCWGVVADPGA